MSYRTDRVDELTREFQKNEATIRRAAPELMRLYRILSDSLKQRQHLLDELDDLPNMHEPSDN